MRLAIIPARGGSKRIARKNIRPFCGRPMIAWSIHAARDSGVFDRIVVSTDDAEIAETARAHGAEVPFMRPAELSGDHTPTVPVIAHAIKALDAGAQATACCLYATAPFVQPADLRAGAETLEESGADYAFSVTTYAFPIQRALRLLANGRVAMIAPENTALRSQDLEETYHDAGQFYFGRAAAWQAGKQPLGPDSVPLVLPRHRVQDIDTPEDWTRAELLFEAWQRRGAP